MERAPRNDRTALVVEDDTFTLSALAEILEDDGYDVHTASNGFSALRQVAATQPAVILLDIVLPERSGLEVLEELRADPVHRDMAIVLISGRLESMSPAELAEADGVLGKPFDIDDLLMVVRRALQRASARRDEVARVGQVARRDAAARLRRGTTSHHARSSH
jgi:CheY-like chemotaxis protein